MTQTLQGYLKACLLSYSQIFFSQNIALAVLLLLATFMNPLVGLIGFLSVMIALIAGRVLGLNQTFLNNGAYTYNVLLSALALGAVLPISAASIIFIIMAAVLCLLISVWMAGFLNRFKLPYLSFPFIITVWIVLICIRHIHAFDLPLQPTALMIGETFSGKLTNHLPIWFGAYLKTLSMALFQNSSIAGILVAIGLFLYSRIAFGISFVSFLIGAYTVAYFQHEALFLSVHQSGFNYIFLSVSLCGYFLIPSLSSYLLALTLAPIVFVFQVSLQSVVEPLQVPVYSLSFSFVVLMILSVLQNRTYFKYFLQVQYQLFSPEKNLYAYHIYKERFKKDTYIHLHLPFYGEWMVTQAHDGKNTHQGDYRYAWDFEVVDELKKAFKGNGRDVTDYYCYGLPILAPADGYVVNMKDGIDDNNIGDVNLNDNWGNSIVIKHDELLFSKISHIKKNSFKVKQGDYVKKGDIIALCGNSGRSPQPHLHFQIQNSAKIGEKTILYPISYFLSKQKEAYALHAFESPQLNQIVFKPFPNAAIRNAFHFIPGMKLSFEIDSDGITTIENWEVFTNSLNQSYLYCQQTGATAYFTNNETLFYFTAFIGNKKSFLYLFYLSAQKILLSNYPKLTVLDALAIDTNQNLLAGIIQDFLAPFYIYTKPYFASGVKEELTGDHQQIYKIVSNTYQSNNLKSKAIYNFEIEINEKGIQHISITHQNKCIKAKSI